MKTALNRLLSYEQPQKYIVETENYSETFSTPVLTAGKSFILGYTNETMGVYNGKESPVIIFDDFTGDKKCVDFDFKVKSSAMKLLHKVNTSDNLKYLFYALQSIKYTPFSHKRIWISEYSNFLIEYRHPQEQNAIVLALDGINQAIYNKKQELFSLDELVKSRFIEMFENKDFGECLFEDICDCLRNGANIKQSKTASGYPITRIETLSNDKFNLDRMGYADIFDLEKYRKYLLQTDDILISHINSTAYLGRAVRYKGESNTPIIHGMNLLCARIKPMYNATYIEHYLKSVRAKDYIRSITKQAVNQASISTTELKLMPISVPPIELQNEFAEFVKLIDKSKFIVQQQIKDLQELLDSKMDEYFR